MLFFENHYFELCLTCKIWWTKLKSYPSQNVIAHAVTQHKFSKSWHNGVKIVSSANTARRMELTLRHLYCEVFYGYYWQLDFTWLSKFPVLPLPTPNTRTHIHTHRGHVAQVSRSFFSLFILVTLTILPLSPLPFQLLLESKNPY